ncbi:hypothetical protein B0H10DRAFT_1948743 [Mycena sp. CBHHK59/15]|nr:hypothetical protein B0H10DRAFT_1948743 [Mycena sp. CBHHK59/15]
MSLPQEIVDTIIDDVGDPESLGRFRGRAIKESGGYGASRTAWSSQSGINETRHAHVRRAHHGHGHHFDGRVTDKPVPSWMLTKPLQNGTGDGTAVTGHRIWWIQAFTCFSQYTISLAVMGAPKLKGRNNNQLAFCCLGLNVFNASVHKAEVDASRYAEKFG